MIVSGKDQIQGWKEIAAHLGRDERTVKRWEKQRGLPVRRIPGAGRANVYLVLDELDAWLAAGSGQQIALEGAETGSVDDDAVLSANAGSATAVPLPAAAGETAPSFGATRAAQPGPSSTAHTDIASPGAPPRRTPARGAAVLAGIAALALLAGVPALRVWRPSPHLIAASPGKDLPGSRPRAHRPELDQLYLQAVYLCEVRTPESLRGARSLFEQVLAAAPDDAAAWSGLAKTFLLLREYAPMPPEEAYGRAWDAATRAIALDPDLAEAHASLGFVGFFSLWRPEAAAREFETAIRLDPADALAHHWYGSMLMHQGRFPEALEQLGIAQHLNPTSNAVVSTRALALGYSGHREEGIALLESLIRSDPGAAGPHRNLAFLALVEPRDPARFLAESRRFAVMGEHRPLLRGLDAAEQALHRGGEPAMWTALLAEQRRLQPEATRPTMLMAVAETALGHTDAALDDLRLLADRRDGAAMGMVIDPMLRPLHTDPRFQRIAGSVGLTPLPTILSTAVLRPAPAH